jgi:hypothetical protein
VGSTGQFCEVDNLTELPRPELFSSPLKLNIYLTGVRPLCKTYLLLLCKRASAPLK